jgi:hypothetical protein
MSSFVMLLLHTISKTLSYALLNKATEIESAAFLYSMYGSLQSASSEISVAT